MDENNITENLIKDNQYGFYFYDSNNNNISRNNLINNKIHANFYDSFDNKWNENYWDDWIGLRFRFGIKRILLSFLPKVITGKIRSRDKDRNRFNFDFSPESKPYEIVIENGE